MVLIHYYDNYGIVIADGDVDGNDVTESDDSYDYYTNTSDDDDDDDDDYDEYWLWSVIFL